MKLGFLCKLVGLPICIISLLFAACSNNISSSTPQSGPIELRFWGYNPEVKDQCAIFNQQQSKIHMTCEEAIPSNNTFIAVLISFIKAGNAPDIALVEYMYIPTLIANNGLVDIAQYVNDVKSQFQTAAWGQVQYGNAVYGLPQDSGPEGLFYNKKIFDQAGVTAPPATWDEYYEAAKKIRALGKDYYISAFAPSTNGWFQALFWQAGAIWFSIEKGNTWRININSAASKKVTDYWDKMVKEGLVATDQARGDFSSGWNKAINDGKIATWVSAVWGQGVISGNAKDQSGNWRVAHMPQWTVGKKVSAMWGGSGISVIKGSKHEKEAAEFVKWYLTNDKSQEIGKKIGWWTSNKAANAKYNSAPSDFYGGQVVSESFTDVTVDSSWRFPTNLLNVNNFQTDLFNKALTDKSSLTDVLPNLQKKAVDDLKSTGAKIVEGSK
jgi:multiple sugar transport system substrate-binding protein